MGLTPEQQKRCDEIVERVLAMEPAARDASVQEACGGDGELREEVFALLSTDPGKVSLFDMSPAVRMMPANFGRYRTEELVGAGGMSVVYRCMDPMIDRRVAIKVMAQRLEASTEEYQRFLTELHVLGSLGHPNIVQVFDAGDYQGLPFIVMEYLEGENLAEAIANNHVPSFSSKVSIARQTADALKRVHEAKVCHRDIKPANVFLERDGRVKLMDFGVSARLNGPRMTQAGALIGTLPYLSPEQLRGELPGSSVDIYAFGVLLYEMFTGSKPFSGEPAQLLYRIAHDSIPLAPLAGLPSGLVALIRKCTDKDSTRRPHDFAQVLQALDRVAGEPAGPGPATHRRWRLGIAAAATVAFVLLGWLWISNRQHSDRPAATRTFPGPIAEVSIPKAKSAAPPPEAASPLTSSMPVPVETKSPKATPPESNSRQRADVPPKPVSPAPSGAIGETRFSPSDARQKAQIQTAEPPVIPLSAIGPKLPDAIPGLKEPLRNPDPPIAAPPAPSPAAQQRAIDGQKIREVVGQYAAAYRNKNVAAIRSVYPSTGDLRNLEKTFADTKTMDFQLEPQADPEIEGDQAKVRCKRSVVQIPFERSVLHHEVDGERKTTPPRDVIVSLARKDGTWRITSIQ